MSERKIKILAVDDEQAMVDIIKQIFENKGYVVIGTTKADQAISLYESEKPDISILDVRLDNQEQDGIDILDQIKEINQDAKCIILSRVTDEDIINKAFELDVVKYIEKPFKYEEFVSIIEEIKKELLSKE